MNTKKIPEVIRYFNLRKPSQTEELGDLQPASTNSASQITGIHATNRSSILILLLQNTRAFDRKFAIPRPLNLNIERLGAKIPIGIIDRHFHSSFHTTIIIYLIKKSMIFVVFVRSSAIMC